MKPLGYVGPVLILLLGASISVGLSLLKKDPAQSNRAVQSALVEVSSVDSCATGFRISVDGEVVPYREVSLSAQVAGRIAMKSAQARAGHYVHQGDLILEIDPRDFELDVRRFQEAVKQATSSIDELDVEESNAEELVALATERLELSRNNLKRFEDLIKRNATSPSELDSARQAALEALNSLQTLKNQITLIRARRNRLLQEKERAITSLEQAELNLSRTKITSPLDGVVIDDFVEEGDFVSVGTNLVQLEDTSRVEVRFHLRLDQLRWLWKSGAEEMASVASSGYKYKLPNVPVEVRFELDGNEFIWPARLDRYDGAGINSDTRTVPIIAVVVDEPRAVSARDVGGKLAWSAPPKLLRGAYVTVDVPVGNDMNLVAIPATAIQPNDTIWIYDAGKLRVQPVDVAYSDLNQVIVMADPLNVKPGDLVITSPLPIAEDGMAVRIDREGSQVTKEGRAARTAGELQAS